jgi:lipopolysaccharide transport system permease protein
MAGLLPWQLFSRALTQASSSLVSMQGMMTKTYFPRLIAPLSEILACLPDFFISLVLLALVMAWYGVIPGYGAFLLPLLILLAVVTSLSVALWLAALNIEYRDVQFALPFLAQLWMYATPVVYSLTSIPEKWLWLIALNPMTVVVEGFRWALLGKPWVLSTTDILVSMVSVVFFLVTGLRYFDKVQRTFADRV